MARPGGSDARRWRASVPHPWHCGQMFERSDSDIGCGKPISNIGLGRLDGNVDHIDGNPRNHSWDNLRLLHVICHLTHHGPPTAEQRAAISEKLKGRPSPTKGMKFPNRAKPGKRVIRQGAEHKSNRGVTRSPEVRAQIAEKLRGRKFPDRSGINHWSFGTKQPDHSARLREKVVCVDCKREFNIVWLTRHKKEGKCNRDL